MSGYPTKICEGSNGQLLVTVPKQWAKIEGFGRGSTIIWKRDRKTGKIIGEVRK